MVGHLRSLNGFFEFHKRKGCAFLFALWVYSTPAGADFAAGLPDPTRPYAKPERSAAARAVNVPSMPFILQSTLVAPDRKLALINGKLARVGERVGDVEILEIQPHQVIVSRAGVRQVVRLLPEAPGLHRQGSARRNYDL